MVNFRRSYLKLIAVASTMVTVATLAEGWWDSAGQPIRSFSVKDDPSAVTFGQSGQGLFYFKELLKEGDYILVGGRNYVYNISLFTLQEVSRIEWRVSDSDQVNCQAMMKSMDECQNYIRVLARGPRDSMLTVCGTNAFKPRCRTYSMDRDGQYALEDEENGIAKCPYDPSQNNTGIMADGRLFTATVADLSSRDALIFSEPMRTEQHDSQWLNKPNFVASMEVGELVYFFFRETAIETLNCGKTIYSRVARICKSDRGGNRILDGVWTSFFKARLNCSVPGEFPFYFDEIQAVSDMQEGSVSLSTEQADNLIYAIFTTPQNSMPASAVCAFRMSDVVRSFEGAFREQRTPQSAWLPVRDVDTPQPHPAKECPTDSTALSDQTLSFIKTHPLMDRAVPPAGRGPQLIQTSPRYRLTAIAIDWQVKAANGMRYDVIFVGTDNGRVLKTLNKDAVNATGSVVLEEIVVFEDASPIIRLMIHRSGASAKLVVISEHDIRSLPVERCQLADSCRKCISLRDPYCSWESPKCTNFAKGYQSVESGTHSACPPLRAPGGGGGYRGSTESADWSRPDGTSPFPSTTSSSSSEAASTSSSPRPVTENASFYSPVAIVDVLDECSGSRKASVGAFMVSIVVTAILALMLGLLCGAYLHRRYSRSHEREQLSGWSLSLRNGFKRSNGGHSKDIENKADEKTYLNNMHQPDVAASATGGFGSPQTQCMCTHNRVSNEYS